MGILGSSPGMAELGKSLTDLKILKNLAVVRETLLYNRTFVLAVAEDKAILSNETAVTATFRTFIDYIAPVTAVISVGITSATSFISASTFSAALNDFSEIEDIYRFGEGNG